MIVNHYDGRNIAGVLYTVTPFFGVKNQCALKSAREVSYFENKK